MTIKTSHPRRDRSSMASAIAALVLTTEAVSAAPFLYGSGDLLLSFRQSGNASDFVVNLGRATEYAEVPAGTTIPVPNLTASQFALAFPSINGVSWSVAGANRPPGDGANPLQTLWVSAPRPDPNTQSVPWLRKGSFVQGTAAAQVAGVGANAASASSLQPSGPDNTATGVVISSTSDFAITPLLGDGGDFSGTFQGLVEAVIPDDFDTDPGNVSRLDLYELIPGTSTAGTLNAPGRFLGYFELKADGSLSFSNVTGAVPAPVIRDITRSGDVTTVSFATTAGARYTLRAVGASGFSTPPSTWPAGASLTGDGSVQRLEDVSTASIRFYVVEVTP